MPQNKFEILRDRVMQKGEGSGKEIGKDRREILREEKERKMKIKVQKKNLEKKKEKKVDNEKEKKIEKEERKMEKEEKIEKVREEREVEMRGFSGGEILKGRYPLAWQKVWCYECGGLGHRKRDHGEMKMMKKDKKEKDKIEKDEIEKKIR